MLEKPILYQYLLKSSSFQEFLRVDIIGRGRTCSFNRLKRLSSISELIDYDYWELIDKRKL